MSLSNDKHATRPAVVLCIGGHDPSGGAGIQADIESVVAAGGYALTLITCSTVQDSVALKQSLPTDTGLLESQWHCLLGDIRPDAIKLGALGSRENAECLAHLLEQLFDTPASGVGKPAGDLPLIIDPVTRASHGGELDGELEGGLAGGLAGDLVGELGSDSVSEVIARQLLPLATVATPNRSEAVTLAEMAGQNGTGPDAANAESAAAQLSRLGGASSRHGPAILLTAGDDPAAAANITNRLFVDGAVVGSWDWPRLTGAFHGSGCTLASAIAVQLARGADLHAACQRGQQYADHAIRHAVRLGAGQSLPRRLPT